MKIDKFTKVVLLVIAVFLGIIALKPLVLVKTTSASPRSLDYIKPLGGAINGFFVLDTRNGHVWLYCYEEYIKDIRPYYAGRLIELGKPLVKKKK